ncbi:MAG: hypothetical protein C0425_04080 [Chlorobiaceae bacterium]|nr:hypothetical protein [Chlorobiaceae bacterium]MBA4309494.1 hypothetical protein [Chlorobiaceae bacterium]
MKLTSATLVFILLTTLNFAQVEYGPFVGGVTETSAVFVLKTFGVQEAEIEYSFTQDFKYSKKTLIQSTDSVFFYTKIYQSNLVPNKKYYYRAIVDGTPDWKIHSFKTFPKEKRTNFSFGFGACQQSGYSQWQPTIFPVMAKDSLRLFLQLGDWTYPDTTERRWNYRFNERKDLLAKAFDSRYSYDYPFGSLILSKTPIAYTYDDHDFAANNPDGTDKAKANTIEIYKKLFPHYPLANPDNGIWQKFQFGDVEFFVLDLRSQRNINDTVSVRRGKFSPPKGHSILAGFEITGQNQRDWLAESLKNSTAKWKVIVSSVIFNQRYIEVFDNDSLKNKFRWITNDAVDKWAGFPEDLQFVTRTIKENDIQNVIFVTGDSHSSYIDDGTNSIFPEISSANLDVRNSKLDQRMSNEGLKIWNKGSYAGDGYAYGRVRFFYEEKDFAILEIVDDKGEIVVSHKIYAK